MYLFNIGVSYICRYEPPNCPGWMFVPRKPHPKGNEYHTLACALSKIIFFHEIVEGKDRPPHLGLQKYESAEVGKTAALMLRMTECLSGTGTIVGMDSGFASVQGLAMMASKGVYGSIVCKKKGRNWPKHIDGTEIESYMAGKAVGVTECRQGVLHGQTVHLHT